MGQVKTPFVHDRPVVYRQCPWICKKVSNLDTCKRGLPRRSTVAGSRLLTAPPHIRDTPRSETREKKRLVNTADLVTYDL